MRRGGGPRTRCLALIYQLGTGQVDTGPVCGTPSPCRRRRRTRQRCMSSIAPAHGTRVAPRGLVPGPRSLRSRKTRTQCSHGHRDVELPATVRQPVLYTGVGVVAVSQVIAGRGLGTIGHSGGLPTAHGRSTNGRHPLPSFLESPGWRTLPQAGVPRTAVLPSPGAISRQSYPDPLSPLGVGRVILLPLGSVCPPRHQARGCACW
jgi:hypothetical protein